MSLEYTYKAARKIIDEAARKIVNKPKPKPKSADSNKTPRTEIDYDMGTKTLKVRRVNKSPATPGSRNRGAGRGRTYKSFK